MLNVICFFVLFNGVKINIAAYWEIVYYLTYQDKIKSGGLHVYKAFSH